MQTHSHSTFQTSRREFLAKMAKGALFVGASTCLPSSWAQSADALAFRKGAQPLMLHFNENSLGMSANALAAAQQAIKELGNRYPDGPVDQLKQALAKKHGVPSSQVILGNGSTEIIGAVIEHAALHNATVIEPTPTFGDVRRRAKARGLTIVQVPVGGDFTTDIDALKKRAEKISGAVLVNLCNPNNPTGTIADQTALEQWIKNASSRITFLVDEAYYEYAQTNPKYRSALPLILDGQENLVITRTFSKIYGMAGMRIGYGIAAPKTATAINSLATSFNLSIAGIAAANASLTDQAFFNTSLNANQQAKQILLSTLSDMGLSHIDSNTNFVLHRINSDLASYTARMAAQGIKVGRRMTADDGWNRLSLGRPDEMQEFSKVLTAFREKGWV